MRQLPVFQAPIQQQEHKLGRPWWGYKGPVRSVQTEAEPVHLSHTSRTSPETSMGS